MTDISSKKLNIINSLTVSSKKLATMSPLALFPVIKILKLRRRFWNDNAEQKQKVLKADAQEPANLMTLQSRQ